MAFTNESKNSTTFTNEDKTAQDFFLLIDDTYQLLIDDTYKFLIGTSETTAYINETKN